MIATATPEERNAILLRLADLLDNDPRIADHFDMATYISNAAHVEHTFDANRAVESLRRGDADCGTSACAAGWAHVLADEIGAPAGISSSALSDWLAPNAPVDSSWCWMFGSAWPNDRHQAAARIRYRVEHGGPPDEWSRDAPDAYALELPVAVTA